MTFVRQLFFPRPRRLPLPRLVSTLAASAMVAALAYASPAVPGTPAAQPGPSLEQVQERLASLALPWVPNAGQWDARAAYRAQSFAGSVWLTRDGTLVHQFNGPKAADCTEHPGPRGKHKREAACPRAPGWVLTERFVGARIDEIRGREEAAGRVSYQVGDASRHANNLPTYGALDLGEIYPGVQVTLRASQSNVEKLYTVAPGRDAGVIRMQLQGARSVRLTAEGALEALTDHGPIRFTAPVAFQEDARGQRQPVEVAYVLASAMDDSSGVHYGFRLGTYDRSRPVTIDPLLQSTYLGGGGTDIAYALAIHPVSGDVYVAGSTISTDLPGTAGGAQASGGASTDAFVTRFNAALTTRLQSTYLGGLSIDVGYALAIHPLTGEVYVSGYTLSSDLPGTAGGAQASKGAVDDAFVTRFNAQLTTRLQSTYLGGGGGDIARALAIHPLSGEIYVAGNTTSTDFPGTTGGAQAGKGVGTDAFVTRFNAQLTTRLQSTYLGGGGFDFALALAIHPISGEVYAAGYTDSTELPGTSGGAQASKGAGTDAFVTRFNAQLTSRLQSTYLGGGSTDDARALAIHPLSGEVYAAGYTQSTDLPGATGGAQATKGVGNDAFVTRFNAQLTTRLQSTYLGGGADDHAQALAIHPLSGEVYVAGYTQSTDLPGTTGAAQVSKGAFHDAFVTRFNAQLTTRLQSTYLGGGDNDYARALAIHPLSGEVYVAGETSSTDLPGTAGGAQATKGTGTDAFVSRLSLDLMAADVVPDAFTLPAQFGVPTSSLRTVGPVQVSGLAAAAPITIDGALGSAFCISTTAACSCDASPGGVFGTTGSIANNQYLCVRHVSAPSASTLAESRVVVGGFATKFSTYTGTLPACSLDMNGDSVINATQEALVITRALLGFSPAAAVAGTGITEAQWNARRAALIACGNTFP